MHVSKSIILWGLVHALTVDAKFRPRPNVPDDISIPNPNRPNAPGLRPISDQGDSVASTEQTHAHLDTLNQKLEGVALGVDAVKEVVNAFNDDQSSTRSRPVIGDEATETSGSTSLTKPTNTAAYTSYRACRSFASVISSCTLATPSFYSLAPSLQASCACYTVTTTSTACSGTGSQRVTQPTFATQLDDRAFTCHEFLDDVGFERAADALEGVGGQTGLGLGFCAGFQGNGSQTLAASPIGGCLPVQTSIPVTAGGRKLGGLTGFDVSIFVTVPTVVVFVSFVLFS